jgi:DNA-binding MurR/RpiR family transcriptional regulator
LQVNQSTLKNVCRSLGIKRWPQRKLSCLESLRSSIDVIDADSSADNNNEDKAAAAADNGANSGTTNTCTHLADYADDNAKKV